MTFPPAPKLPTTYCEDLSRDEMIALVKEMIAHGEGKPFPPGSIFKEVQIRINKDLGLTDSRSFAVARMCVRDEVFVRYIFVAERAKARGDE